MRQTLSKVASFFVAILLLVGTLSPAAFAVTDEQVSDVIAQLEAIDTLETMQNKRYSYKVNTRQYNVTTTNTAVITEHQTARSQYDTYVAKMFAARLAAQEAYNALTDEQKAQIDPTLAAKLSDDLSTLFRTETYSVTPRDDEYMFETVRGGTGMGYEVSNHMVAQTIPQTFVLVDTSNGETSWTPSGPYVPGESNYTVTYCCDMLTGLEYAQHYKMLNLEDSGYFDAACAQKVRGILRNAYPFVSLDEMKDALKADGLDAGFVDSLTRADVISAVQMAVWTFSNYKDLDGIVYGYYASVDVTKNTGKWFYPIHDFTNETWDWLPRAGQQTYDAAAGYRVNTLLWYLCNLDGVEAPSNAHVITDIEITRAELLANNDGTYHVGMRVHVNGTPSAEDDVTVIVTSYSENSDGGRNVTSETRYALNGENSLDLLIKANLNDTIEVVADGMQKMPSDIYFFEPEGGRHVSLSLVGAGEGEIRVHAEEEFVLQEDIKMGLRIYKTAKDSRHPLSEITFHIYEVALEEGETLSEQPTDEEIAKYVTEENLVASVVTDATGYAAAELEKGIYMIVEEHNAEKVKAPVSPFYVYIPMPVEKETTDSDGNTQTKIEYVDIVSAYPKNEPVVPPPPPPPPPPPENVKGQFAILKHETGDETIVLEGAKFQVYRTATAADTDPEMIVSGNKEYAVVPVMDGNAPLVLITDENGIATSPELDCGVYFLVEIEAPRGYKLLEEAVCVTVSPNEVTELDAYRIPNTRGPILPETGGMGTKLFLIFGGMFTLGAAILLVAKKRMQSYV